MRVSDGDLWHCEATIDSAISYHYELKRAGETIRTEEGETHTIEVVEGVTEYYKRDFWRAEPLSKPLNSSLFSKVVFKRQNPESVTIEPNQTLIECRCEMIRPSQRLAIVGVSKEFGHWDGEKAMIMADGEYPIWRATLPRIGVHTEYKYVILDSESGKVVAWEQGDNRMVEPYNFDSNESSLSVISDLAPKFDIQPWRATGVAIPIFSLRTERSMGVGDFGDLRSMVDWAVKRGMSVIQILPINDTTMGGTWMDSYPYNANSTIALHPQYLALREVGVIEDESLRAKFERKAKRLEALPKIDYTEVTKLKTSYLKEIFSKQMPKLKRSSEYKEFITENRWWLEPYALFSVLRDRFKTPDFTEWKEYATYNKKLLSQAKKERETLHEMEYYFFVQYHLHIQLTRATQYARERGVALKGDIPIGISRTSVDAWIYPELFNMSSQAGAPPDPFSDLGQNWGFPTYNWERMAKDNYAWWQARFKKMAEYFDAYRIDHILGFFRIWEIPMGSIHGLTGYFNPALPLSIEEIEASGFSFSKSYTEPYVTDSTLNALNLSGIDRTEFFTPTEDGRYHFREEYDTQRKIAAKVSNEAIREGLMMLHNEVLFIEDNIKRGLYHPRILGASSLAYKALSQSQRNAFDFLHHDFYYIRHTDFWRESAMKKLPTLASSTEMLVCGEDLGMIPACVADVMQSEQILSLEIERMPKDVGVAFATPAHYPYLSVCTCSTHDMTTIRGWWREDQQLTQRYYNEALGHHGAAPEECSVELAREMVERHKNSPAMLTILPWQDWMACDGELRNPDVESERINVPANSRHYWRYRMHIKI